MSRKSSDWGGASAAFAIMITVNGLANALPLAGRTTGEVSALYPSPFTPAGFTFAIWGLIYLALGLFVAYQALPTQRENAMLGRISRPFIISCLINSGWIFAWHYGQLWLSLVLMLGLLIALISIYRTLSEGSADTPALVRLPFSIYLGWITVASIANLSAVQTAMGWDDVGVSAIEWTLLKITVAGAIGAVMVLRSRDAAFALVVAWAAVGILASQVGATAIYGSAATVAGLLIGLSAYHLFHRPVGNR